MRLRLEKRERLLRIVHVCNGLAMGGMEKLLAEFARHGDRERFELHFVGVGEDPPRGRGLSGMVVEEIARLGWGVTMLGEPEGVRVGLVPRLARLFWKLGADVVHTHNTKPLLYAGPAARLAGVRAVVHTRHGQRFGYAGRQTMMFRWASRFLDRMVCVSSDSARIAIEEGIAPRRVCTILNGVDLSRFCFTGGAVDGPAVMVGRLSAAKDVGTLIRAAGIVVNKRPDFRLEIAGDGPCRPELERLVDELSLRGHVRLLGRVDDVPGLLGRASMCVLSSLTEGIPLTLLEGMATGLPVVATRVGGIPEVVDDPGECPRQCRGRSGTGLLVRSRAPEELGRAMLALWRDPALRREMGRTGRARVEASFDVRTMVARYEALYEDVLSDASMWHGRPSLVRAQRTGGTPMPRVA